MSSEIDEVIKQKQLMPFGELVDKVIDQHQKTDTIDNLDMRVILTRIVKPLKPFDNDEVERLIDGIHPNQLQQMSLINLVLLEHNVTERWIKKYEKFVIDWNVVLDHQKISDEYIVELKLKGLVE